MPRAIGMLRVRWMPQVTGTAERNSFLIPNGTLLHPVGEPNKFYRTTGGDLSISPNVDWLITVESVLEGAGFNLVDGRIFMFPNSQNSPIRYEFFIRTQGHLVGGSSPFDSIPPLGVEGVMDAISAEVPSGPMNMEATRSLERQVENLVDRYLDRQRALASANAAPGPRRGIARTPVEMDLTQVVGTGGNAIVFENTVPVGNVTVNYQYTPDENMVNWRHEAACEKLAEREPQPTLSALWRD